jgi:SAM-dependent methyltransferase
MAPPSIASGVSPCNRQITVAPRLIGLYDKIMGLLGKIGIRRKRARIAPRQSGWQHERLDGVSDILRRARDASVLDVGCNRGLVSMEFAWHGQGPDAIASAFGPDYQRQYDIVLLLAVYQEIRDAITPAERRLLIRHLALRTGKFFVFRDHIHLYAEVEPVLNECGLEQVHRSLLGPFKRAPGSIWAHKGVIRYRDTSCSTHAESFNQITG